MDFTSWVPGFRPTSSSDGKGELGAGKPERAGRGGHAGQMGKARGSQSGILKRGNAMRVIFFYPGEEGTYVDNADVTLFENGIVHIASSQEETTTHLQNCEILWHFETDAEERTNKVRLLKPKSEARSTLTPSGDPEDDGSKPGKKGAPKEVQ